MFAAYSDWSAGVAALGRIFGNGLQSAVLEYLDAGAVDALAAAVPGRLQANTSFLVIAEADGGRGGRAAGG